MVKKPAMYEINYIKLVNDGYRQVKRYPKGGSCIISPGFV